MISVYLPEEDTGFDGIFYWIFIEIWRGVVQVLFWYLTHFANLDFQIFTNIVHALKVNIELTRIINSSHNNHNDKHKLINHDSNNKWLTEEMEMNSILKLFVTNSNKINSHEANEES